MTTSQSGARSRRKGRGHSKWEILFRHLVHWYIRAGLRLIVLESISCWGRIRLQWRTKGGSLLFQVVKKSLPFVSYDARYIENENYACSEGIQTLLRQRPWMSLGDDELFLQGWFQALRWRDHIVNIEHRTECLETSYSQAQQVYAAPSSSAIDQT